MEQLEGRTAVVTGGGSGIGRGIALALADRGVNVVVASLSASTSAAVAREVSSRGVQGLAMPTDVADLDSVMALADRAFAHFGEVHVLCNNAGVSLGAVSIVDLTYDDWAWVLNVNLWGVVHGLLAFLPRMRAQRGDKHVVNMASRSGLIGMPGHGAYVASKFAVVGISETLADELVDDDVGVTVVCPSRVASRITDADRNRPAGVRGPRSSMPPRETAHPGVLDPIEVGRMVVGAIEARQLYLLTHDGVRDDVVARAARVIGAAI